MPRLNIMV